MEAVPGRCGGILSFVGTNDDDPDERFADICKQVRTVFGPAGAPSAAHELTNTTPRCAVIMIPWTGVKGSLEALLNDAAVLADKNIATQTTTYLDCVHWENWDSEVKKGKAWLWANGIYFL